MENAFALTQNKKFWGTLTTVKPLTGNQKWDYLLSSEIRLIDQAETWQSMVLQAGVGYLFSAASSFWFGYYWRGNYPFSDFYQTNRLWQQLSLQTQHFRQLRVFSRTRLEESVRSSSEKVSWRLRQRIGTDYEFAKNSWFTPRIYEEAFFQLNDTNYTTHHLFSENRIFAGVNVKTSAGTSWEIGYISEYLFHGPGNGENQLNHIISVACYIG